MREKKVEKLLYYTDTQQREREEYENFIYEYIITTTLSDVSLPAAAETSAYPYIERD